MYNLCYRCESGQEALLHCGMKRVLDRIKELHSGDPQILYQCRRLELALKKDGWRGNVEENIEREMKGDDIDSMWLHSVDEADGLSSILEPVAVEKSVSGGQSDDKRQSKDNDGSKSPRSSAEAKGFAKDTADSKNIGSKQDDGDDDDSVASDLTQ